MKYDPNKQYKTPAGIERTSGTAAFLKTCLNKMTFSEIPLLRAKKLETAPYSYWREVFSTLFKNKVALICFGLLFVILFFTIFGPIMLKQVRANQILS